VTASASPAAAQTLTEIVTISATVSRSVAAIRIVTAGTDADGKAMDLGSKTCENASACSMDFGGNSNTYSGAVTYTAYACEHKDPCDADNNLGSDEGTFTVAATLNKPSRLVVASAARCCTNRGISIDLVWGSVVDATRYEIGYQFAGGSFVKVGDSVVTDYSFEIQQAGAYPLILSVRACNAIVCSEYTTVTIATSPK
jgi:hypothetical protein